MPTGLPGLTFCTLREALARARDATAKVLEAYTLEEAAGSNELRENA